MADKPINLSAFDAIAQPAPQQAAPQAPQVNLSAFDATVAPTQQLQPQGLDPISQAMVVLQNSPVTENVQYPVEIPAQPTAGERFIAGANTTTRALAKLTGTASNSSYLGKTSAKVEAFDKAVEKAKAAGQEIEGASFAQKAAEVAGGLVDPASLLVGGAVAKGVGKLFKPAITAAADTGVAQLSKVLSNKAAAEAAAFGGVNQALTTAGDQVQQGQFEPGQLLLNTGAGIVTGGLLGKAGGKFFNRVSTLEKQLAQGRTMQEIAGLAENVGAHFDPKPPTPAVASQVPKASVDQVKIFTAQEVKQAKLINSRFTRIEGLIRQNAEVLENPNSTDAQRATAKNAIGKLFGRQERLKVELSKEMEHPAYQALREAKEAAQNVTITRAGREVPLYKTQLTKQGVYVPPSEVDILSSSKDVGRFASSDISSVDMVRLAQEADGFQANGPIRQLIFQPAEDAITQVANRVTEMRNSFRQKVIDLKVNTSKQNMAKLADAMEGNLDDTGKASLRKEDWDFINHTKELYRNLLDENNEIRRKLGYPEIRARKDYMTHIQEWSVMDKLGAALDSGEVSQTAPKFIKKLRASFGFEKARQGGKFVKDPIQAFEAYLEPAIRQIETMQPAAMLHARAQYLPARMQYATKQWINSAVLGGADAKDKAIIETLGKFPLEAISAVQNTLSSGVILGNLKVIAQQPSQILATARETGFMPMLRGLAYGANLKQVPQAIQKQSSFLNLRNISDDAVELPKGILGKPAQFLGKALDFTDKAVARASWAAGFDKAQRLGLSTPEAVRYADDVARMLHAQYKELYRPALLRGRSGRALAPFQTFAFNSWNYLTRDAKVKAEMENTGVARQVMTTIGTMAATNMVYEWMGMQGPFALEMPQEASAVGFGQAGLNTALGQIPLTKQFVEQGTPSPLVNQVVSEFKGDHNAIMRNLATALLSDDDDKREKAFDNSKRNIAKFFPGGVQIYRSIKGIDDVSKGYVEKGGEFIELTPQDKAHALLFGTNNAPSVRKARQAQDLAKTKKKLGIEDE